MAAGGVVVVGCGEGGVGRGDDGGGVRGGCGRKAGVVAVAGASMGSGGEGEDGGED